MHREPWHTDNRLWALGAVFVFVALGFIDPLAGATWKRDNTLWVYFGLLLQGESNTEELLRTISFRALLQAVPAALVGWVFQAMVLVVWSSIRTLGR